MEITEERIDEIFEAINSTEKTASKEKSEVEDIDSFVEELEKNAAMIKEAMDKEGNKEDAEKFEEKAVGGELQVDDNDPDRQRLKEIMMNGIKNDASSEEYQKLRRMLAGKEPAKDKEAMIENLSDRLAEEMLNGEDA